jgi:hypothetical protein
VLGNPHLHFCFGSWWSREAIQSCLRGVPEPVKAGQSQPRRLRRLAGRRSEAATPSDRSPCVIPVMPPPSAQPSCGNAFAGNSAFPTGPCDIQNCMTLQHRLTGTLGKRGQRVHQGFRVVAGTPGRSGRSPHRQTIRRCSHGGYAGRNIAPDAVREEPCTAKALNQLATCRK